MNIYINPEKSPAAIQAKASGSPISGLRFKRGANLNLSVVVMGSTTACNLRFGIKAKGDYEGSLLAYAESATGQLSDEGMKFDLSLAVTSVALNEAFNVGSGNAATAATLSAVAEFAWQDDGAERLSDTINTTLINDIIRLATEAPEAAAGEYPSPDLVATKSWVNQLKASAAQAGLVLLEADAIIEGEHTAVALTAAGTIAIPLASASESGTVILGTDTPISGRNILPVGKDSSGKLAVSADGLSAFDSAKKAGFVGTEEEWVASLKGEQGEPGEPGPQGIQGMQGEQGVPGASAYDMAVANGYEGSEAEWLSTLGIDVLYDKALVTPEAGEESDYDAYGFGVIMKGEGLLQSLTIECRANTAPVGTEPVWCKVWKGEELIALSSNSQVHGVGKMLTWEFDPFTVQPGVEYRFLFYKSGSKDLTNFTTDFSGCFRVVRKSTTDGVGMIGAAGGYATSGATSWQPVYKMVFLTPRYTPAIHAADTTLHLTAEEHSGLIQLLARKDALLALLNT